MDTYDEATHRFFKDSKVVCLKAPRSADERLSVPTRQVMRSAIIAAMLNGAFPSDVELKS